MSIGTSNSNQWIYSLQKKGWFSRWCDVSKADDEARKQEYILNLVEELGSEKEKGDHCQGEEN